MTDTLLIDSNQAAEPCAQPAGWTCIAGEAALTISRQYRSPDGAMLAGVWTCTPAKFEITYDRAEFCHLIEGRCAITATGEETKIYGPGDSFMVSAGFKGQWEVLEPVVKHFLVVTAPGTFQSERS